MSIIDDEYDYGNNPEEYANFLREALTRTSEPPSIGFYVDPDTTGSVKSACPYYEHLARFLNIKWKKRTKERAESSPSEPTSRLFFLPPTKLVGSNKLPGQFQSTRKNYNSSGAACKIAVCEWKENNEIELLFYLSSDQLGFTANPATGFTENKKWSESRDTRYPIPQAIEQLNELTPNDKKEKLEETIDFLASYVAKTRSLGGGFLWATNEGNQNVNYNLFRGVRSYLEDRVDLTLWEVRDYFSARQSDGSSKLKSTEQKKSASSQPVKKNILREESLTKYMQQWFNFFDSFEDYVDFLELTPFVTEQYIPIDIYESDLRKEHIIPLEFENIGIRAIRNLPEPQTEQPGGTTGLDNILRVLRNVQDLVCERTEKMREIIANDSRDSDKFWRTLNQLS